MGMHAGRLLPVPALFLLTALAAALAHGAPVLGMVWSFAVTVGSVTFALPAGFPFALLAGALALACWGRAEPDGRRWFGVTGLGLAGSALLGSYAVLFLVWGPWGGTEAQFALLGDVARLGFAVLALSLPVALPDETPPSLRVGAGVAGVLLAPLMLFPASFADAGVPGAVDGLPLLLFLAQGALPVSGPAQERAADWLQARRDAWDDWDDEPAASEPAVEALAASRARGTRPLDALRPRSRAEERMQGRGTPRRWGRGSRADAGPDRWF